MAGIGASGGTDAALLAWGRECLLADRRWDSPLPDTWQDLADGRALLAIARPLLPESAATVFAQVPQPNGRLAQVAEILRLAQPSRADTLREDAKALLQRLFIVVFVVEGSRREQAVECIGRMDTVHQEALKGLLTQNLEVAAEGGSTSQSPAATEVAKRFSVQAVPEIDRRSSLMPIRSGPDGAAKADAEDEDEEGEMLTEVEELEKELKDRQARCEYFREMQQHEQARLKGIQEELGREHDFCADLEKEMEERWTEKRELSNEVRYLKEELQEAGSVEHCRRQEVLRRIEEQKSECRLLQRRYVEVEQRVEDAYKTNSDGRLTWKETNDTNKLKRLWGEGRRLNQHLRDTRELEATEHRHHVDLTSKLRHQEALLRERDEELRSLEVRVRGQEEGVQQAQSRLEVCQEELRMLKMNSPEDLRAELQLRQSKEQQAKISFEEATTRFGELQEHYNSAWQLSQALQDRTSPDPATARLSRLSVTLRKSEEQVQDLRPKLGSGTSLSTAVSEEESAEGELREARRVLEAAKREADCMEREAEESRRALAQMREEARCRDAEDLALAEEEARQCAAERARRAQALAEEESRRREAAEEARRREAMEEARRREAEEEERRREAEEEERRREAEEARRALAMAEEEARQREAEEARRARALAEEEQEATRRREAEEARRTLALAEEEARRRQAEEQARQLARRREEARRAAVEAEAEEASAVAEEAGILEEQLALREREQRHREILASEAEERHSREMRLMASSLHRLGLRYSRLLSQVGR